MSESDCLFCRIVAGEIPAERVHEDERTLAFRDVSPEAPLHVLVIPKEHVSSLAQTDDSHGELLGELLRAVHAIASAHGVADAGFRTVINTGDDGGQTVHHLHVHLLAGRPMTWPPG